jgi:hypothetical protein
MVPLSVVVSWALLILRSSHAECLVGDRQFWVTRPYEWKQLLAAKLLFVAVFVDLPLLILQVFLLVMDGYQPASHISGLLWLQLLWLLCVILPVMTLGYGWVQSSAVMGAEFGIDPFIFRQLEVRDWGATSRLVSICVPGNAANDIYRLGRFAAHSHRTQY